jgi:hypothetical protein
MHMILALLIFNIAKNVQMFDTHTMWRWGGWVALSPNSQLSSG